MFGCCCTEELATEVVVGPQSTHPTLPVGLPLETPREAKAQPEKRAEIAAAPAPKIETKAEPEAPPLPPSAAPAPKETPVQEKEPARLEEAAPGSAVPLSGTEFVVKLVKGDCTRIGLDTVARKVPPALKIKRLKPGLVEDWNRANPGQQVKKDDLILKVNGENTDVEKMYQMIADKSTIELLIRAA